MLYTLPYLIFGLSFEVSQEKIRNYSLHFTTENINRSLEKFFFKIKLLSNSSMKPSLKYILTSLIFYNKFNTSEK